MGRNQKDVYCFLSDEAGMFYSAIQQTNGDYTITKNNQPYPIKFNPSNLLNSPAEFGTNTKYFSLVRTIAYPLDFIKDGAAILRDFYLLRKGIEQKCYLTMIQWDGSKYVLSYTGKIDFPQKKEIPKTGTFTVSTIDDTAWGVLSQNDTVTYAIDCSATNPKAIKVLFDGMTLVNKYNYQSVQSPITHYDGPSYTIPFVLINQDGDSSGIVSKSQSFSSYGTLTDIPDSPSWFFNTLYAITDVNINGSFTFEWSNNIGNRSSGGVKIFFISSTGQIETIFSKPGVNQLVNGQIYSINFNFTWDLAASESIWFVVQITDNTARMMTITPIVTNVFVSVNTRPQSIVAYGLRPLDLLQQIVNKATNSRFTINSNYFRINNKSILFSGDSLRGIPNAKLYTSFYDFFQTFDCINYMALRTILGELWMEQVIEVYKQNSTIIDIGEAIDIETEPAVEYYCNEVEIGSPDIDMRHPSGRLEFNSTNTWSLPIQSINKKLSLITKYRLGCFDEQFLILDYKGESTQDNSGDKQVYVAEITDNLGTAIDDIETFENFTVNNVPLEPIIKSPLDNDTITYNKPTIKGVAPASSNINIYIDSVLDGNTTSIGGNWTYNISGALESYLLGIHTGIHVIDATYTDMSAPRSTITIVIDTTFVTDVMITKPALNDHLYNNIPLLKGTGQFGTPVNLILDGVALVTVNPDQSCRWEFQSPVLSNGNHILSANGNAINFTVDTNVAFPLITYIGSEIDGFPLINNLPLVRGVALPNILIELWLNYVSYTTLGTTVSDANGNWSFQVVPKNYTDPLTGLDVIVAPIRNGLNIISTSLLNHTVGVEVTGYLLNRPLFSSITGVTDNTVWNTSYSPKRMMLNRSPLWASILNQQQNENIYFQKPGKNGNLSTTLAGVTVTESTDIPSYSLGNPIALLEIANIKTKTSLTFAKALENFNNGGVIKTRYRGTDLYALPIGSMKMAYITDEVQEWKLLLSPLTTYSSLLNLYKNGLIINIMKNSIYHSDYNSLHFVSYNFQDNPKYNFKTIYQDWFNNRNDAWILNPDYIQKFQTTEIIRDQIVSNGLSNLVLRMYRCIDASLVADIPYVAVAPAPIKPPEVVLEAVVDFSMYNEDQYFFVKGLITAPTLILAPYQKSTSLNNWSFTLSGTVVNGDTVTVSYYVNGSLIPIVISSIASVGWNITDILNALLSQISTDTHFIFSEIRTIEGHSGIRVETLYSVTGFVTTTSVTQVTTNLSISERVQTKLKWDNTILIEASNSINKTGIFFSTGFKTILRVEGLIKKLQPNVEMFVANEESGNNELLYSQVSRKRSIRFGTAYGLPDYLYLKMADAITLDDFKAEGVNYVLESGEKITPSDDISGHPLYYYNVNVNPAVNTRGIVIAGNNLAERNGVILVVDAAAFGLPAGSLININVE